MAVEIPELLAPRRKAVAAEQADTGRGHASFTNYNDLMGLFDDLFVKAVYPLLLGRKADDVGIRYYCARLRRGHSRLSVIDQMIRSPEARQDWPELPGLQKAIEEYRKSRRVGGWKLALRDPELGRLPGHRRARALANAFGAQQQVLLAAIDRLGKRQQVSERMLLELLEERETSPAAASSGSVRTTRKKKAQATGTRSIKDVRELPSTYRGLLDGLRF